MPKPKLIDDALTYGSFPMVFGGAMGVALYGISKGWDPVLTATALTGAVVVALLVLERLHPYRKEWLRGRGDIRTDLIHNLVNATIPQVYTVAFVGGFTVGASWLSETLGATLWPTGWPMIAQLLLALVIGEVGTYWIHRLMHENPFLWRFHAAHHSAPRLYWLNAGRFHPLDLFAQYFLSVTPLILLGANTGVIALHALYTVIHGMFQHCNVDIRLGPFNWFFSMAELHRWHHSKNVEEANTNYGANIIWWDIVFRSRFLPDDRRPPAEIGIESLPDFPKGYWGHLSSPFRWTAIERSTR
ncbi:MAG: sterol desaturase family protein [Deltaproteobacteria bacterium]|nr:sterol desaturase family protein [Deltaproteobacteria bacterium]